MPQVDALRPAVLAIFLNRRGEILIGSSPRDGGYKIPQGGLDPGENPLQGVIREVYEELGVRLSKSDISPMAEETVTYLYPPEEPLRNSYIGQKFSVFLVQYKEEMNPQPQDDEFDELIWIKPSELRNYDTRHRAEAYGLALRLYGL